MIKDVLEDAVDVLLATDTELYFSDRAKQLRKDLENISACMSEHQYYLTMLERRYKAFQKTYLDYLKINEEKK